LNFEFGICLVVLVVFGFGIYLYRNLDVMASNHVKTFKIIKKQVKALNIPWVTKVSDRNNDPYKVLISCILSLRTKDKTTAQASERLFKVADNPRKLVKLKSSSIAKLIYPVGFYRNKTKTIIGLSKNILAQHNGKVPNSLEGLLALKGVGRKTANLVLGLSFNKPAICVDTHVHRISNRLGWIKTKTAFETEEALKKVLPRSLWIDLNTVLVGFGQNLCLPVSPLCSRCKARQYCPQIGVKTHR
jgi:endonuclease-3